MSKIKKKTARKKVVNKKPQFNIYQEVIPIIIIAVGLIIGISIFSNAAGIFGEHFKKICFGLLGYTAYVIPIILTGYGIHRAIKKENFDSLYKYSLAAVLIIICSAILHILFYNSDIDMSLKENIAFYFMVAQNGDGGGVIGFLIAEPIINMFGLWGSGIILFAFAIIIIIITTEISIFKVTGILYNWLKTNIVSVFNNINKSINDKKDRKVEIEDIIIDDTGQITIDMDNPQAGHIEDNELEIKVYPDKKTKDSKEDNNKAKNHDKQNNIEHKSNDKNKDENEDVENYMQGVISSEQYINYVFPPVDILSMPKQYDNEKGSYADLRKNAKKLTETLKSFGVDAKILQVSRGPTVTRYELQPSIGVKVSKIVNLSDDIALNLAASTVRIEAPIPGKAAIGIEVPNEKVTMVHLREVIESKEFSTHSSKLAFALGKDIAGKNIIADVGKMPHLLIAGATGSGKSVCINTLIISILYNAHPNEVKLVMIDPKVVELGIYNGIPHLLIPVVTDAKKAAGALNWAVQEMVNRYTLFADNNVRDLKGYNEAMKDKEQGELLPNIVIIIDELADLMMVAPNDVEDAICRLAQMARAAGMHLIIATQRPSVDVITGVIKANVPSRISFYVSSQVDSRTILDMGGAEKLLGKGDMLFYPVGSPKPQRLQGAFISDKEVENVVQYIKTHSGSNYSEDIIEKIETENKAPQIEEENIDELLPQAIEMVVENEQASISMLQRRLRVGYARAARMVDQMEARGIIGGFEGSKPRQVLINRDQYNEMLMHSDENI